MPIANCYVHQLTVSRQQGEELAREWAETIEVDIKDICLSFIEVSQQAGQPYKVMVNLYLPTLWDQPSRERIQLGLDKLLKKHFTLREEEVFIITQLVQSGSVVEQGKVVKWE